MVITMEKKEILKYIIVKGRWVFVCFVLLPFAITCKLMENFKDLIASFQPPEQTHSFRVKKIKNQILNRAKCQIQIPMCSERPGWKSMTPSEIKYKEYYYKIDVFLPYILELDTIKKTVTVEPSVSFGYLIRYLISTGWTLPVVIELDDITVGGIAATMGLQSSSHVYGLFQSICVSYEVVLGDGSLVTCSKNENEELFYSIPGSYGTLGFITSIEIKIIPAKRYVQVSYEPVRSLNKIKSAFESSLMNEENEFLEALVFDLNEAVIISGKFVDTVPTDRTINRIGKWYKPWFFKHVQEVLNTPRGYTEFIPLIDYYHRHNRSLFWELQDIIPFGNNAIFRALFGWAMPPKISFLKKTQTETIKQLYIENHIVQDLSVPLADLQKLLSLIDEHIKVYPLWLCPIKFYNEPGMVRLNNGSCDMHVDVGIYGEPKSKKYHYQKTIMLMENILLQRNGYQFLYSGTYLEEDEFRKMYDHELYDKVREKYQCWKAFPTLYEKVNKQARI